MSHPELSVIVPAYNEQNRLPATVQGMIVYLRRTARVFELIVVDDGSTDRTPEVADEFAAATPEARVLRVPRNRGKGHAVRTGVQAATGTRILFADADGATPMQELERLEAALGAGADVAIGSRARETAETTLKTRWHRREIGRIFRGCVYVLGTRGIHDTQCGFKLFRGPVAHALFAQSRIDGFAFDVEVLLLAQRAGLTIAEVPVNWSHQRGSRINLVTDSLKMLGDLARIRLGVLLGQYPLPLPEA